MILGSAVLLSTLALNPVVAARGQTTCNEPRPDRGALLMGHRRRAYAGRGGIIFTRYPSATGVR
jgi:hypothetical protein